MSHFFSKTGLVGGGPCPIGILRSDGNRESDVSARTSPQWLRSRGPKLAGYFRILLRCRSHPIYRPPHHHFPWFRAPLLCSKMEILSLPCLGVLVSPSFRQAGCLGRGVGWNGRLRFLQRDTPSSKVCRLSRYVSLGMPIARQQIKLGNHCFF